MGWRHQSVCVKVFEIVHGSEKRAFSKLSSIRSGTWMGGCNLVQTIGAVTKALIYAAIPSKIGGGGDKYFRQKRVGKRWINVRPYCIWRWSNIAHQGGVQSLAAARVSSLNRLGGGPRVVVSTAAFHARVRGSVPGLGGLKETKNVSSPSTCESQYCGEPPWPKGSVLGLRPPGFEFRILCLEDSVISIISPSSGGSPGPV